MESSRPSRRAAALVAAVAFVVLLAACGGGDDGDTSPSGDPATTTTAAGERAPATTAGGGGGGDGVAAAGDTVAVHYTGTLDDGSQFDSSEGREPLQFTIGSGQVIGGFDEAVTGMRVGETVVVHIAPEEAYGQYDPEAKMEFPIDEVPEEYREVGVDVPMGGFNGKVLEVTDELVIIDVNHPLAGQALNFEIELVEIVGG